MSYFIALSFLPISHSKPPSVEALGFLPCDFRLIPLAPCDIRRAVAGKGGREAYLLVSGMYSHDLLGRGRVSDRQVEECRNFLLHAKDVFGGVALLVHWFGGLVTDETISDVKELRLDRATFSDVFPRLEDDVRYLCI